MSQESPGGSPTEPRNEMNSGIPGKSADSGVPAISIQAALDALKKAFPQTVFIGVPAPGKSAGKAPVIFDWNGDPASLAGWLAWLQSMLLSDLSSVVMGTGEEGEDPGTELGSEVLGVDEDLDAASRAAVLSELAGLELQGLRTPGPARAGDSQDPGRPTPAVRLSAEEIAAMQVLPPPA